MPIDRETIDTIIENSDSAQDVVRRLTASELASLVFIQQLAGQKDPRSNAERHLAGILKTCHQHSEQEGTIGLAQYIYDSMQMGRLECGLGVIEELGIGLRQSRHGHSGSNRLWGTQPLGVDGIVVDEKPVVVTINQRSQTLPRDQSRIYREVEAQYDDNLHIQGYAGTGKTTLIKFLFDIYEKHSAQVLVLGETKRQLAALNPVTYDHRRIHFRTFSALSRELIPPDYNNPEYNNLRRWTRSQTVISDKEVCKILGIPENDLLAQNVRRTMYKFCQRTDSEIDQNSIPQSVAMGMDLYQKTAIVEYTKRLWEYFVLPNEGSIVADIETDHLIKLATLNRWSISKHYTHIFIDECHNLSDAVQMLLDFSPQTVISLGDDFQSLRGIAFQRPEAIRLREMTDSIRSGSGVDGIVNPMISLHPGLRKNRFESNKNNPFEISYYSRRVPPKDPYVILASDSWGLFEWGQRLSVERSPITLLSSVQQLNIFVSDCIELYKHGTRPRHHELSRYKSWSDVFQANSGNPSFFYVSRMLDSGYNNKSWEDAKALFREKSNQSKHAIGLITDARNHEFDSVMLTAHIKQPKNREILATYINQMYTAVTRARRRLLLPEDMRDWIEEIAPSCYWMDKK